MLRAFSARVSGLPRRAGGLLRLALLLQPSPPWLCRESFGKAGVVVRSSNYTLYALYGDMSARVMQPPPLLRRVEACSSGAEQSGAEHERLFMPPFVSLAVFSGGTNSTAS